MAKKQEAEKELAAKNAELQGADTKVVKDTEKIESEADSNLIDEIKSNTWITPE
ncbi:MAG: ribosomal protein, partial [Sphingobacterium sp.]|nr:ribosomal protein [Sphingobacterium sp.]